MTSSIYNKIFPYLLAVFVAIFAFSPISVLAIDYNLQVSTNGASNVTSYSAVMQGTLGTDYIGALARPVAWIEYGTSTSLGLTTTPRPFTSQSPILREQLVNLRPNTEYYARVVAQTPNDTIYGRTISFFTFPVGGQQIDQGSSSGGNTEQNSGNQNQVDVDIDVGSGSNGNTGQGDGGDTATEGGDANGQVGSTPTQFSRLYLRVDDEFETFRLGDILTYNIVAQNVTEDDLNDIFLVVELPSEIGYLGDIGRGIYRPEDHEIVFEIGDLDPGERRELLFNTRAITEMVQGQQLIVKSTAFYTDDAFGVQYESVDFDINRYSNQAGTQIETQKEKKERNGIGFFGWFLIVILLVVMVIVGRKTYMKWKEERDAAKDSDDIYNKYVKYNDDNPLDETTSLVSESKARFDREMKEKEEEVKESENETDSDTFNNLPG